jgi:hypothetical protein
MFYWIFALLAVVSVSWLVSLMRRWFKWPVSLRALFWCGVFSYGALLVLPQIIVWPNRETQILLAFLGIVAALLAWILAYHEN